jgi:hypothetical protein
MSDYDVTCLYSVKQHTAKQKRVGDEWMAATVLADGYRTCLSVDSFLYLYNGPLQMKRVYQICDTNSNRKEMETLARQFNKSP